MLSCLAEVVLPGYYGVGTGDLLLDIGHVAFELAQRYTFFKHLVNLGRRSSGKMSAQSKKIIIHVPSGLWYNKPRNGDSNGTGAAEKESGPDSPIRSAFEHNGRYKRKLNVNYRSTTGGSTDCSP